MTSLPVEDLAPIVHRFPDTESSDRIRPLILVIITRKIDFTTFIIVFIILR